MPFRGSTGGGCRQARRRAEAVRRALVASAAVAAIAAAGALGAAAPSAGSLTGKLMLPSELRIPGFRASGPVATAGIAAYHGETCGPRRRATVAHLTAEGFEGQSRRFFASPNGGADSTIL